MVGTTERVQREKFPWTALLTGLAVGLSFAVLCVVCSSRNLQGAPQVIYLDSPRPRKKARVDNGDAQLSAPAPFSLLPPMAPVAVTQPALVQDYSAAPSRPASSPVRGSATLLKSYRLPSLTDPTASSARVATATKTHACRVLLRVVSPPGVWAAFSNDGNELNSGSSAMPVGNVFIIPSGRDAYVRLQPGQAIFAKGSVPNVVVSVSQDEVD